MKLPNAEHAVIDPRKMEDYLLNPDHDRGQHKARVFAAACGIRAEHAELFRQTLLDAAVGGKTKLGLLEDYGQRYVIEWELEGPTGVAPILTAWIVRAGEDFPRFVACHVT